MHDVFNLAQDAVNTLLGAIGFAADAISSFFSSLCFWC
jgi:hypothetical protein